MIKNSTCSSSFRLHSVRYRSLICIMTGITMMCGQAMASEPVALPSKARAMTAAELHMLYRDKTWVWPDGAGRLQDQGRIFTGWSGTGSNGSWAQGRWILSDTGLMCLKATWHSPTEAVPNKVCFRHFTDGGTIYQRKEPSGDWYVFKHATPADSDEFKKIIAEDTVTAELANRQPSKQNN